MWLVCIVHGLVVTTGRGADVGSLKNMARLPQDQVGVYINLAAKSTVADPMLLRVGVPMIERIDIKHA